jgi:small-conductance mechanosensitive channel
MQNSELLKNLDKIWDFLRTPFLTLNDAKISIVSIMLCLCVIIFSFYLSKKLARLIRFFLIGRGVDTAVADSISQFVKIVVVILGFLFGLESLGFSLSSLAALGAVLMVGIGFGLQNIAQNFISGIIILIERPIKVGDIIQVGTTTGKVLEIRVRSTIVLTRDDISIIVPNSKLIAEEVINESFSGSEIRLHVKVGVSYGSDLEVVKGILLSVAKDNNSVLDTPKPDVIFKDFGDSSLDFDLRVWTNELWHDKRVSSDLRFEIAKQFKIAGVQIPFPQQDIYIKELPKT